MSTATYEALSKVGTTYLRKPEVVHELPTPEERLQALRDALPAVERALGMKAKEQLGFGVLVFRSFKMSHKNALATLNPVHRTLLLTMGQDLPLYYVTAKP